MQSTGECKQVFQCQGLLPFSPYIGWNKILITITCIGMRKTPGSSFNFVLTVFWLFPSLARKFGGAWLNIFLSLSYTINLAPLLTRNSLREIDLEVSERNVSQWCVLSAHADWWSESLSLKSQWFVNGVVWEKPAWCLWQSVFRVWFGQEFGLKINLSQKTEGCFKSHLASC